MDDSLIHKFLNIVAFCSIMESNGGIAGKSPDYILEKFQRYCEAEPHEDNWKFGDATNQAKLKAWADKWMTEKQKAYARKNIKTAHWQDTSTRFYGKSGGNLLTVPVTTAYYDLNQSGQQPKQKKSDPISTESLNKAYEEVMGEKLARRGGEK